MHAALITLAALVPLTCRADDKSIEGKWTLVSLERDGRADDGMKGAVRIHTGDKYTITPPGGETFEGTYKTDASKTPHTIDMVAAGGRYKGQTLHGIYKVEGDTLTICFPTRPEGARPTEFASKPGVALAVHKRAQP